MNFPTFYKLKINSRYQKPARTLSGLYVGQAVEARQRSN